MSWRGLLQATGWQQGEHVTILGPSGSGKTLWARRILELRDYVVVLGVKLEDDSLREFEDEGYERIESWPPPRNVNRALLWPRFRDRDDAVTRGREVMGPALERIVSEQAWTIYVDELHWVSKRLNQQQVLEDVWLLGRSMDTSLVVSAQRPFSVPQPALSQATHLFLAGTSDERDLKRLAEIGGGIPKDELRHIVSTLPKHAFAYVNTRDQTVSVSRLSIPRR